MAPEDRAAMIEGMVAGLADRLATEGGPPEDWARLITAFGVLGRREQAQAVYDEALTVFADAIRPRWNRSRRRAAPARAAE
jgi:cytochrome c-type biogenesis protein CcmH